MTAFEKLLAQSFRLTILEEPFVLAKMDGRWALQRAADARVRPIFLDEPEVRAAFALAHSSPHQASKLQSAGIEMDNAATPELEALRKQVPGNSVLIDTRTLANADLALTYPDPFGLLDLSVATFALVTFDHVIIQPYLNVSALRKYLGDAICELSYSRDFIAGRLW